MTDSLSDAALDCPHCGAPLDGDECAVESCAHHRTPLDLVIGHRVCLFAAALVALGLLLRGCSDVG